MMLFVSDAYTTPPDNFHTQLQKEVYSMLQNLHIPFERVDTDEAITMEDCIQINEKLNVKVVKTLFLCNRQKTNFYLFITRGDKPFKTKDFSKALEISRVSFAPANLMEEMLGTKVGSATILSTILDTNNKVQIVVDKEVLEEEWYGCSDGTTTGYMKVKTSEIMHDFLEHVNHVPKII